MIKTTPRARKQADRLGADEHMQALTKICLRCLHDYCSKQWKLSQPVVVSLTAFLLNWFPPPANTTTHTDTLIPVGSRCCSQWHVGCSLAPKDTRAMMLDGQADRLIDDLVSMCQLSPGHLQLFYEQPLDYLRQEYGARHL
jgi:hypothetical protein